MSIWKLYPGAAMKQVRIERVLSIEKGYLLADVTCWFPLSLEAENSESGAKDLYNVLVSPERTVWGVPLTSNIGCVHDHWERYIYVQKRFPLSRESVTEAVEWIEQKTNEAAEVIRSVIEDYQKLKEALPSFESIFIDVP